VGSQRPEMVDVRNLGERIRRRRLVENLSLRDVEEQMGGVLTASSLSRIERGALPDAKNVPVLARWLELPLELVGWPGEVGQQSDQLGTPDVVEVHLRADRNLDPAAAEALSQMFRHLYEGVASGKLSMAVEEKKPKG
jgi:transcriptional regulator with XRE-family HTH domain